MCVRYVLHKCALYDRIERIEKKEGQKAERAFFRMVEDHESFPGEDGSIICLPNGELSLETAAWGLQPSWATNRRTGAPDPNYGKRNAYNARAETLLEKPTFRTAFRQRRCIIPASDFYERADGRWLRMTPKNGLVVGIAGLWEPPNDLSETVTYSMVTTTPNEAIAQMHDRMPVVLEERDYDWWLDPERPPESLCGLLVPCPPEWFDMEDAGPVSTKAEEPQGLLFYV